MNSLFNGQKYPISFSYRTPYYRYWGHLRIEVNQIRLYRTVVHQRLYIICRRIQQKWAIVLGQVLQMDVIIEQLVPAFATAAIGPTANVVLWWRTVEAAAHLGHWLIPF